MVAFDPKTLSQLAQALDLSPPSVHTHINDLIRSELIRESKGWEKRHPTERYYEPNFPVFKASDCAEFLELCHEMAERMATLFAKKQSQLRKAFHRTGLAEQGWEFSDITQCVFANVQRDARTLLEQRGVLRSREKHVNGTEWVYWAEEPMDNK